MNTVSMKLVNYKLFEDHEIHLEDPEVIIISGPNEKGKTSIITALQESWSVRGFTPSPLKKGTDQGYTAITGPDKNGEQITIIHNFNKFDQKGEFYAIDSLGRNIKSPSKIRELLGDFKPISLEEVYYMISTSEGRRKFIKEFIFPVLDKDSINEIDQINSDINERTGRLYMLRRDYNSQIKAEEIICDQTRITNSDERYILETGDKYKESINQLRSQLSLEHEKQQSIDNLRIKKDYLIKDYKNLEISILDLEKRHSDTLAKIVSLEREKEQLFESIKLFNDKKVLLHETISSIIIPEFDNSVSERLKSDIEEGENAYNSYIALQTKNKSHLSSLERMANLKVQFDSVDNEIYCKRNRIKEILSNSNLPSNLKIDDDSITLDDFVLDPNQISESSAKLALAELLCKLYSARFITMGNLNAFDSKRLSELVKIAQEHNKIVILEQVDDVTDDIRIIVKIN